MFLEPRNKFDNSLAVFAYVKYNNVYADMVLRKSSKIPFKYHEEMKELVINKNVDCTTFESYGELLYNYLCDNYIINLFFKENKSIKNMNVNEILRCPKFNYYVLKYLECSAANLDNLADGGCENLKESIINNKNCT